MMYNNHSIDLNEEPKAIVLFKEYSSLMAISLAKSPNQLLEWFDIINDFNFKNLEKVETMARGIIDQDVIDIWYFTPIKFLENRKPIDVLETDEGLEKIRTLLKRLERGIPF